MRVMTLRQFGVFLLVLSLITTSSGWRRRRRRRGPNNCSSVPSPPECGLQVTTTNHHYHGSVATFTCKPNYKIGSGDKERTCNDGSWTGTQPTCVLGCDHPRSLPNGHVNIIETSAVYSCSAGFMLIGASRRNCNGRTWSGSTPQCVRPCRTALSNPLYGSVTVADNRATYSCSANYRIDGTAVRLCNNGAWVGTAPSCVLECGNLDKPANGRVTVTGTTAQYVCNLGHRLKGDAVRTCKNKKWIGTTPVCSKVCSTTLDSPDHGSVSVSDDKATYSCFVNYKITGTAIRYCLNGAWLGDNPTCILECHNLENPVNGIITIVGNVAHYTCNPNYRLQGDAVRTCQNNTWTGSRPTCTTGCERLPPPNNGYISFDGQTATFSCRARYRLVGNTAISCVNGQWSQSPPSCVLECGRPFRPLNGAVTLLGATAYFTCNAEYTLYGDYVRECDDGAWTGVQPRCLKDCPSITRPKNGFVTVSRRIATFECYPNYILRGSKTMVCNSQGKWTGQNPLCELSCFVLPMLNGNYTLHGITILNRCNQGYTLHGDTLRLCIRGIWSGTRPSCRKSDIIISND